MGIEVAVDDGEDGRRRRWLKGDEHGLGTNKETVRYRVSLVIETAETRRPQTVCWLEKILFLSF